jgi:hypothetical protein
VRDNAWWCDLVVRTHGIAGRTDPDAWTSPHRTPPGYPDAVTLRPGVDAAGLLSRVDTTVPECSVKDSYADLDLSAHGFRELFAATWIGHAGDGGRASPGPASWSRVTDARGLRRWEAGWGHTAAEPLYRPDLLRTPQVTVLGAWDGHDVVAGAILTSADDAVVGVSNLFSRGDKRDTWAGVLAWAGVHHAGLPLVGYESGDDLVAALDAGFRPLGPLRVWMADDARDGVPALR